MLFQSTVGTVLLYNAETWTTTRALERRTDGIYTRLLCKALDVSWQQHMTNEELCGKIPSAMHQLRERHHTFDGHCYECEDQLVKNLVLWEGRAGRMLRGQANRMTYVKQLLCGSCCETVDELQRKMNNQAEWARVSHTTLSSEWLRSLHKWMDGSHAICYVKFQYSESVC